MAVRSIFYWVGYHWLPVNHLFIAHEDHPPKILFGIDTALIILYEEVPRCKCLQ